MEVLAFNNNNNNNDNKLECKLAMFYKIKRNG